MDGPVHLRRILLAAALAVLASPSSGCVGVTAHLLYFWKGQKVPAAFSELEGKRVAVVCVSDSPGYGPNAAPAMLAQEVEQILGRQVKDVELVHQDDVADWIDRNDWNEIDYRDIGRGVGADMVVAIDLDSLRLHEGPTLYRGRANVKTSVYDMSAGGKIAYAKAPHEFVFPQHTPVPATDMSESQFRKMFADVLAKHVAKHFYDYELKDDFGPDAAFIGQ
jgi:hypothetical protein